MYFQVSHTQITSLTKLSNEDVRIKDMRLKSYPPVYLNIGSKTYWIPAAHWLEERKESIIITRIVNNISENIDINLYFFAGHPRERIGVNEFEKFPYIFLVPFLVGLYDNLNKRKILLFFIGLLIPLALLSVIGNKNQLGPVILFPLFVLLIGYGFNIIYLNYLKGNIKLMVICLLLLLLNLIQVISYQLYV